MNANDVIEAYVSDVGVHLPRKQRNDVAFELRALLSEGLQDKAEASGRDADAAMASEFLQAFGRPESVAARYRPTLTIIDPADGHAFVRASVIGLLLIWTLGLLMRLRPIESAWDVLLVLGPWWGNTVIPSLWWPGVLVVGYGAAAAARRRWPHTAAWIPRDRDRIFGGRTTLALGLVGILCGIYLLVNPTWILDVLWGGRAAPAAYTALSYTDSFRARQGPWLLALLLLNIPMFVAVLVRGRWTPGLRLVETAHALATFIALAWTVLDGPVLQTARGDNTVKFVLVLIIAATLIGVAMKFYRSVRPMPDANARALR